MAYSEELGDRVREVLAMRPGYSERRMFGGLCFLLHGHMVAGAVGEELMVRVGPEAYQDALAQPHAREMTFTGRPMKGMVYVAAAGLTHAAELGAWIDRGASYAGSLPPK